MDEADSASRATFDKLKIPYEVIKRDELYERCPQLATETREFFGVPQTDGRHAEGADACVAVARSFEKKGGRFVLAKASLGSPSRSNLQSVTLSSGETVSAGTFMFAAGPWLFTMFPEVLKNKLMVAKSGTAWSAPAGRQSLLLSEPAEHRRGCRASTDSAWRS